MYRAIGARLGEANVYQSLGRLTEDETWFEQAIALHTQISDSYSVAADKFYFGLVLQKKNEPERALAMFNDAITIFQRIGLPQYVEMVRKQIASE